MNEKYLTDAAKKFANLLIEKINNKQDILILAPSSVDGLISSSIIFYALQQIGGRCTTRITNNFELFLSNLREQDHDYYIFIDYAFSNYNPINKKFNNKCIFIDHSSPFANDLSVISDLCFHTDLYDINGIQEVSSGGLSFLIAQHIDKSVNFLSPLTIVSALAENQDIGENRSLVSINKNLCNLSVELGLVNINQDLAFSLYDHLPIHQSISSVYFPFIDGITWNDDECLSIVKNSGVSLKDEHGIWKPFSDLSDEEKSRIKDAILKHILIKWDQPLDSNKWLNTNIYSITANKSFYCINECRKYLYLLQSCCFKKYYGLGMSLCLGVRGEAYLKIESVLYQFESDLKNTIRLIFNERWRINDGKFITIIYAEGLVNYDLLESVAKILSSGPKYYDKILLLRTANNEGLFRYCISFPPKFYNLINDVISICKNLNIHYINNMNNSVIYVDIPISKLDEFNSSIKKSFKFD